MSKQYFNIKWRSTINELMDALQVEMDPLFENEAKQNLKYVRTDQEWFQYYGKVYLFYVDAYKTLEDSYDQLIHPQKRRLLKKMLEHVMLRQIQIKQNVIFYSTMGNAIRSDFVNFHEILQGEKRLFSSIEVQLPRFFVDDPNKKRDYRAQMVNKFLEEFHDNTQPEEEVLVERMVLDTIESAVWFIQKNERGKQGIDRVMLAKQLRKQDLKKMEKHRKLQEGEEVHESTEREEAITIIQKYYKGYKAREFVWELREKEAVFLGFKVSQPLEDSEEYKKYITNREEMKLKQIERFQEYKDSLIQAKEDLRNNWADDMQGMMMDDRRRWYMSEVYKAEGKQVPAKVTQFYKKDEVRLPLTEEEQELMDLKEKERKAAKKNKGKKKKKKKVEDEDIRVEQGPSEAVIKLQDMINQHNQEWRNDQLNYHQRHEQSLLKQEIAKDVEKEIRSAVDEMIDMELINLKIALKAKKFKYPKKKKSKKKKAKPKKKEENELDFLDDGPPEFVFRSVPKKKKKKFPGDKATNKKDPRDMLAELIEAGVVKKLMPAHLKDLVGDPNPLRQKQEMLQDQVADPSMFDLRQVLVQFVGMPLGSTFIKDNIKESNYILFYGPHGSGKTHAVRALQTECDALVIDLSPANIEDKYTDRPDQLLSLSFKVAACFQPSIIYIDEVERIFKGKKKKKKGGDNPVVSGGMNWIKMRKFLLKYGKYFTEKQKENVAVIGCTYAPWSGNKKQLKSFFKRRIYFPCPNYATRIAIFQKYFAEKHIELHPNFPLNALAHATEGYTAGNIKEALNKILTERRILLTRELGLRVREFIEPLSVQQSTFQQQYLEFRKFHDEFSGNKARIDKLKKPEDDAKRGKGKPAAKRR